MKNIPRIEKYMTRSPFTIGGDIPMRKALEIMREQRIRHLPVLDRGKLIGILSDRDLKLASSFVGGYDLTCEEIMTPETYSVLPEAPLNDVVHEMAVHKYGSAVVQEANGNVVGIFTSVDALLALNEILQGNFRIAVA